MIFGEVQARVRRIFLLDRAYWLGNGPYYLKCIKDGPFEPKTADGADKPESYWTSDERRVVVQDQRLKSIIMSCLPDDIMDSVISCPTAKATWTDLVHSFEGPSGTKENRIMDLKLNLPEKWLTFSQGLRNVNHTQTLDLADIYGRYVYEDDLIQRRNSDDEVDERSSKEYLRDLNLEFHERSLLANLKRHFAKDCFSKTSEPSYKSPATNFSSVLKGFQPKFSPKLIQFSQSLNSQTNPKIQKEYKAEYKKMKGKLALLEAKVTVDEEVTQVKVLMALAEDELTVGKNHVRNGEWIDITIIKGVIGER
ncbi:hypothetical protein Tco_0730667 [Tanacetum coccineum]|uniref:Retrovirus-related Pol polyprotein from transposon TNT 1-94 n=1 Tax=Tanacetum coccineum TaxID=301880 RepID=A0ABQ4YTL6_9ASTR